MKILNRIVWLCALISLGGAEARSQQESYLSWTADEAVKAGKAMRVNGTVGGHFDFRVIHTERSYNYKLRATWLSPEVIRATARLEQLRMRLSDEQTKALVAEAEAEAKTGTVFLVEIDPREGSGVIPLDWRAILQPKGLKVGAPGALTGVSTPALKKVKALAGVAQRDYSYDVFWVVFPLLDDKGAPVFSDSVREIELVVGIYNKEGRVSWPVPESIRQRMGTSKPK